MYQAFILMSQLRTVQNCSQVSSMMRSSENPSLIITMRMNSKSLRSLSTRSGYIVPVFFARCKVLIEYRFPSLDMASMFFVPLGAGANTGRSGLSLKREMASFSPISPTLKFNPRCLASLSISLRSSRRARSFKDFRSTGFFPQLLSLFFIFNFQLRLYF